MTFEHISTRRIEIWLTDEDADIWACVADKFVKRHGKGTDTYLAFTSHLADRSDAETFFALTHVRGVKKHVAQISDGLWAVMSPRERQLASKIFGGDM